MAPANTLCDGENLDIPRATGGLGVVRRRSVLAVIGACAVMAACSEAVPSATATTPTPNVARAISLPPLVTAAPANRERMPSFSASAPAIVGGRRETIGGERPVTLYIPEADAPVPLLSPLHAFGGSGQFQEDYWRSNSGRSPVPATSRSCRLHSRTVVGFLLAHPKPWSNAVRPNRTWVMRLAVGLTQS